MMGVTALRARKDGSWARPEGAFEGCPGMGGALGKATAKGGVLTEEVAFGKALLEEAYVSVVPGSAFGQPGHIRLSVAASDGMLREACQRLSHFLDTLG